MRLKISQTEFDSLNVYMKAKKRGLKAKTKYKACKWEEYYSNKVGRYNHPNHIKKMMADL